MDPLRRFHEVVGERHEYALRWKREKGAPVFGVLGDYVPEEMIYAAGILPVRILGGHEPPHLADPHISPDKWCFLCRDCLAEGLSGKYRYLDGLIITVSCFHLQQSFDSWVQHSPLRYTYCLDMPFYVQGRLARECFTREMEQFRHSLEKWMGDPISPDRLTKAIQIYNKNRQGMRTVYHSRRSNPSWVSGSQAMEMVLASMLMDKEEHNGLLENLIDHAARSVQSPHPGIRLMVIGAESNDTEVVRLIESLGAEVVADVHSLGTRYFWNDISLNGNPVSSIASRYLGKIPLPQMDFPSYTHASTSLRFAKDFNVQGAIFLLNTHCDPFQWEIPIVGRMFEENKIAFMTLELDPIGSSAKTQVRLEAFIEMLKQE